MAADQKRPGESDLLNHISDAASQRGRLDVIRRLPRDEARSPPVGTRRRFTSFSVVVLPEPLRPNSARVSPAPTENEIPSTSDLPLPGS